MDIPQPFIVYLDETGDHSLGSIDPDFPVFVLVMLVCDRGKYINEIVPAIYTFKMDWWGDESIILHSRDIRMSTGDFSFLRDPTKRSRFIDELNHLMAVLDYSIISIGINKEQLKARYATPKNPYALSLTFAMERLYRILKMSGQDSVQLVAEARGRNEDNELKGTFFDILTEGTDYITSKEFKGIDFKLKFIRKSSNIVGTQLADLAAYPTARYIMHPKKENLPFEILKNKFLVIEGKIKGRSFKVFP